MRTYQNFMLTLHYKYGTITTLKGKETHTMLKLSRLQLNSQQNRPVNISALLAERQDW